MAISTKPAIPFFNSFTAKCLSFKTLSFAMQVFLCERFPLKSHFTIKIQLSTVILFLNSQNTVYYKLHDVSTNLFEPCHEKTCFSIFENKEAVHSFNFRYSVFEISIL